MVVLKGTDDFHASMASMAGKVTKRTLPTVTPSISKASSATGARTPESSLRKQVYSQPADTGKGQNIQTQVLYARDHLKEKGVALTLEDILGYLSQLNAEQAVKDALATILRKHPQVEFDQSGFNGRGSYKFRPKHAIRAGIDLLAVLQSYTTFKGLPVKELKEGWPDAEAGITELESEHKALAVRNKKDNTARTVWGDDPTLHVEGEEEFSDMWKTMKVPNEEQALIDAVVKESQQPTGKVKKRATGNGPAKVEKKVKKPRRGGKTTNKHMVGILKDFSHLRR